MNEGKMNISERMWNPNTATIAAHWSDDKFVIDSAFDTDTITLDRSEALKMRDALNCFIDG